MPEAASAGAVPAIVPTSIGSEPRVGALDIGTLLPLTGELSFLAPAAVAGVELAVDDLNAAGGVLGAPVGLRHGDSAEGAADGAQAEAARLLDAGVDVVIGPVSSGAAARVLPQVVEADAVLVSPASSSTGLDALDREGRLFRTGPGEVLQGRALADLVRADGHRSASIAARGDEYGRTIAAAFVERFDQTGGVVEGPVAYDPAADGLGPSVVGRLDTAADAIVVVGLAETALVVEALVAAGEGPRERSVYGTDGNLGDRLGDLVEDRADLACMRGLLPVHAPDDAFAARVRAHDPALADAALDLAAEAYDATVLAALAAQSAGADAGGAVAAALPGASAGGAACPDPARCLELLAEGADVEYRGETGPTALDGAGNRTAGSFTVVAFDDDGHLARLGPHRGRS